MNDRQTLRATFVLLWTLAIVNAVGVYYYLYWLLPWLDIVTHFLGGMALAFAVLWVWYHSGYLGDVRPIVRSRAFVIALVSVLAIGALWEVYEVIVWRIAGTPFPVEYVPDTLLDLVMDTLGALVAVTLFVRTPKGVSVSKHPA